MIDGLNIQTNIIRNDLIPFNVVDNEVVMMSIDNGKYYSLDDIGSRIWIMIDRAMSIEKIVETMVGEYDIGEETCRKDVLELIEKFYANGLIKIV